MTSLKMLEKDNESVSGKSSAVDGKLDGYFYVKPLTYVIMSAYCRDIPNHAEKYNIVF